MIYVDPSSVLGILLEESDAKILFDRLSSHDVRQINIVGAAECCLGLGRAIGDFAAACKLVERFFHEMQIEIVGVPSNLFQLLTTAIPRYARGTGHPAKLNLGDLFSYVHCRNSDMPILFKGEDFVHTDLVGA